MDVITILLGLLTVVNILLALLVIFWERRDAGASWAWLLVLFFLPVVGFCLYLLFGKSLRKHRLFEWEDREKIGIEPILKRQLEQLAFNEFEFRNKSTYDNQDLIYMHLRGNESVLTENNHVDIFTDGKQKFDRLFKDIEEAKKHIHIQYYIIKNDNLGKAFIRLLTKKAKEGLAVRILYDELGSRSLTKRFFKEFREAGGQVEVFFPSKLPL